MSERVVIEEAIPPRSAALKVTVVRKGSNGYWISTIPYGDFGSYETQVYEFHGYESVERAGKPTHQKLEPVENRGWQLFDVFKDNPNQAKDYHDQVIEKVAEFLEEN